MGKAANMTSTAYYTRFRRQNRKEGGGVGVGAWKPGSFKTITCSDQTFHSVAVVLLSGLSPLHGIVDWIGAIQP